VSDSVSILVTGATGYIGGLLVPELLRRGYRVRVLARDPAGLQGRDWLARVEVVQGDVLNPASLAAPMAGIDVAYYLVHSMLAGEGFERRDVSAAEDFGRAAAAAGVDRIIYLGGLGDPNANLSSHLRSRHDTGKALGAGGVLVTEFRAAVVVGAGSASFEMIRYLTERVPVMICPSWVYTRVQPIAIHDVLAYLAAAPAVPASAGRVIEIGGTDILAYGDLMLGYARARSLRRRLLPVPVLTPRLSSHWVGLVTPLAAAIARPLIDGLRNEVVVRDQAAQALFPQVQPLGFHAALELALAPLGQGQFENPGQPALPVPEASGPAVVRADLQGMFVDRRQRLIDAPPAEVYRRFARLGGRNGWLYANWLWALRGRLDRLLGGPGAQGRRDLDAAHLGDVIDLWRVDRLEPGRHMRLRAEMSVPGAAWMSFEARPQPNNKTLLVQSNLFAPRGLWGALSWILLIPIHRVVFGGLLRALALRAEAAKKAADGTRRPTTTLPAPQPAGPVPK
jgi:uncharacterized protein YbjT (DUF2867 family)